MAINPPTQVPAQGPATLIASHTLNVADQPYVIPGGAQTLRLAIANAVQGPGQVEFTYDTGGISQHPIQARMGHGTDDFPVVQQAPPRLIVTVRNTSTNHAVIHVEVWS